MCSSNPGSPGLVNPGVVNPGVAALHIAMPELSPAYVVTLSPSSLAPRTSARGSRSQTDNFARSHAVTNYYAAWLPMRPSPGVHPRGDGTNTCVGPRLSNVPGSPAPRAPQHRHLRCHQARQGSVPGPRQPDSGLQYLRPQGAVALRPSHPTRCSHSSLSLRRKKASRWR
jgi:hypothetical protein